MSFEENLQKYKQNMATSLNFKITMKSQVNSETLPKQLEKIIKCLAKPSLSKNMISYMSKLSLSFDLFNRIAEHMCSTDFQFTQAHKLKNQDIELAMNRKAIHIAVLINQTDFTFNATKLSTYQPKHHLNDKSKQNVERKIKQ